MDIKEEPNLKTIVKKKFTTKNLILISLFAAMSSILYFFPKFPLPIFPEFLEINFSMLPIIMCSLLLGSTEGFLVTLIRFIVKLFIISSHTAGAGEIADLIIGSSVACSIGLANAYIKMKNLNIKAIITLAIGCFTWITIAVLSNWLINVPIYIALYFGGNESIFVKTLSVIPGVNESNYMARYLLLAVIPFNLLISVIVSLVTYFVYRNVRKYLQD